MRHLLTTQIDLDAAPIVVWAQLTDLGAFREWNPFITEAEGKVEVGETIRIHIEPPGGKPMTFRPRITDARPGVRLEWLGRLVLPGLFDGRHRFEMSPIAGGTRLVHSEVFGGLLVPLMRASLDENTRAGFEAMNRALADRLASLGGRA